MRVCVRVYIYIYIFMYVCMCVCLSLFVCVYIHTCIHTYNGCWHLTMCACACRNVIVAFQQFITIYVNEYRCIDDDVASATKVYVCIYACMYVFHNLCDGHRVCIDR